MTTAVGIWYEFTRLIILKILIYIYRSLILEPGVSQTVEPLADIRISNISLAHELKDATGRSSLKITFQPPTPSPLDSDEEDEEEPTPPEPAEVILASLTPGKVC